MLYKKSVSLTFYALKLNFLSSQPIYCAAKLLKISYKMKGSQGHHGYKLMKLQKKKFKERQYHVDLNFLQKK